MHAIGVTGTRSHQRSRVPAGQAFGEEALAIHSDDLRDLRFNNGSTSPDEFTRPALMEANGSAAVPAPHLSDSKAQPRFAPGDGTSASDTDDRRARFYDSVRLVVDTAVAAVALVVLSLPILILAILIKLDSPGPAFFRQQRIGRYGRPFEILKFRTMHVSAPKYSYKLRSDHQLVTRLGRVLRRSGLDEVPQLWNVVRTEMRLIGPRPEQPFIVAQYEPWQHRRHVIAPGITGWWQVHNRNEIPMHLNLEYDLYYIAHRSAALDARIAWRTLAIIANGVRRGRTPATETRPIGRV